MSAVGALSHEPGAGGRRPDLPVDFTHLRPRKHFALNAAIGFVVHFLTLRTFLSSHASLAQGHFHPLLFTFFLNIFLMFDYF